ncbi:peptidase domain-containing ABC transporter [Micromonospora sp. NBC_00617]|uniref:peptidase domain-containing ABC transporter n=1 Tax=Micromonospora sp. NBC_00617 TaxID=2903587 RepID=UPI0030E252D6
MMSRRVPVILQTAASDCGVAALAMILAAHQRPVSVAHLRAALDAGRDGLTMRDLRAAAIDHGLRCRAIALPALRSRPERIRGLALPLIAHWRGDHYIVVVRVRHRHVEVVDPAVGRRHLTLDEFASGVTGAVLLFAPDGPAPAPSAPPASAVRLLAVPQLRRQWRLLTLLGAVSALMAAFGLAVPLATKTIVDSLTQHEAPQSVWFVAVAALALAMSALSLSRGLCVALLQRRIGERLGRDAVEHLLRASYRFLERRFAGDLVDRVQSAFGIPQLLASQFIASGIDALLAVGYLIVVAVLAPAVAAITAVSMVVQLVVAAWLSFRVAGLQREELLASGEQASKLSDALRGIATIRAVGAENRVLQRWSRAFDRGLDAQQRKSRMDALSGAVLSAWQIASPVLILLVAARTTTSPGTAVGLAVLAGAATAPAAMLATRLPAFAVLAPTLERLADIAQAPAEQPRQRPSAPRLTGQISLEAVSFRYDRRSPQALADITVTIESGMKLAVVGGSGSGKSTLVSLLTGLHTATEGTIRYDGHDVADLDLPTLRRQLGVVLQDPYVGAGTIAEALTLARPDATAEQIDRALTLAAIRDELYALPMGLQTQLGDSGAGLSGGQRQRLALARALLDEPAVLILDEATSALDVVTEATVERNLRSLPMTRVVIAHRLSTVIDADLVLVLEGGRLVECGPPAQLIAANDRFATMVSASGVPAPAMLPPRRASYWSAA